MLLNVLASQIRYFTIFVLLSIVNYFLVLYDDLIYIQSDNSFLKTLLTFCYNKPS